MRLLVILLLTAPAWSANAEPLELRALQATPADSPSFSLSTRIWGSVNDYSNETAVRLHALTLGLVDMKFDLHKKRARFNLGGGDPKAFRLCLDSNIVIGEGKAHVQAQLDLALAGYQMQIEIPDIDLHSESVSGKRAYVLSMPLVTQRF